jgi:hypothetical protein
VVPRPPLYKGRPGLSASASRRPRHGGRWETIRYAPDSNARTFLTCLILPVAIVPPCGWCGRGADSAYAVRRFAFPGMPANRESVYPDGWRRRLNEWLVASRIGLDSARRLGATGDDRALGLKNPGPHVTRPMRQILLSNAPCRICTTGNLPRLGG